MPSTREPHTGMSEIADGPSRWCANTTDCQAFIDPGVPRFEDTAKGRTYCQSCGQRLRFHRKRALARGETLPLTFEDVERRFAAAGI